jgi:FXSXX-COOH protein
MADPARRALVDLSEADLAALNPAKGSVLEHALERVRRERDRDVSEYASFINTTDLPRRGRDGDG